jgi:hypothetical protein
MNEEKLNATMIDTSLPESDQIGFVYFIRERGREDGPIKIGHTQRSPDARLRDIVTMSPVELEVAAWARGSVWHERALHQRFAADRLHGEWFRATPAIRELIDAAKRDGDLGIVLTDATIPQLHRVNSLARGSIELNVPSCGPTCSFCGASNKERRRLIRGPDETARAVYICNECVDACIEILGEGSLVDVAKGAEALLRAFDHLRKEAERIVTKYATSDATSDQAGVKR